MEKALLVPVQTHEAGKNGAPEMQETVTIIFQWMNPLKK